MKLTNKKINEIKVWEYFIPDNCKWMKKTDKDVEMFFEWSEQGKHKDLISIPTFKEEGRTYFHALVWGKKWAMRHVHEMWEPDFLRMDGSWPGYIEITQGFKEEEKMPREVVDWLKKEIFKGSHAEIIEQCYIGKTIYEMDSK